MKHHITGAYFSPTGGTKRALEALCGCWETEDIDYVELGGEKNRANQVQLDKNDLLVLALPVYADTIPEVEGLLDGLHGDGTPCVVVAAYGNCKYGHALAQMKKLAEQRGFRCVGGAAVITPHVFAPTLGTDRPDEEDVAVLKAFAAGVSEKLKGEEWTSVQLPGDPDAPCRTVKPVPKMRDWDICMGCAFCAYVCPTGAMDPKSLLWDDDKCISCMTCVSRCPNGALGYNSSAVASKLTQRFTQRMPVETFL